MRVLGDNIPNLKAVDSCLRFIVIPVSFATIWLTVTTQEDNTTYGKLNFSNFTGLKYLVFISAISGGYALLATFLTWIKLLRAKAWVFFISDQLVAHLMVTSAAIVAEIMYLAFHGDREVTWSEACTTYGKFCNRLKLILSLNSISICCFLILAVISAFRAFSNFEPPFLPSKETQEQGEGRT